jgi:hypothetical protein
MKRNTKPMKPTLTLLTALLLAPQAVLAQDNNSPGTSMIAPKLLGSVEIAATAAPLLAPNLSHRGTEITERKDIAHTLCTPCLRESTLFLTTASLLPYAKVLAENDS